MSDTPSEDGVNIYWLFGVVNALKESVGLLKRVYEGHPLDREMLTNKIHEFSSLGMSFEAILLDMEAKLPEISKDDMDAHAVPTAEPQAEKKIKRPSLHQVEQAQFLLRLSEDAFATTPKRNADYITLDSQGKGQKNAVSVLRDHITFMVSDYSNEQEARRLGLTTDRIEKFKKSKRLAFRDVSLEQLQSNAEFFKKLLADAKSAIDPSV